MEKKLKTKWLKALRSGKYKQGRQSLHNAFGNMCCLGVLCDIQGAKFLHKKKGSEDLVTEMLPSLYNAKLTKDERILLANKNDNGKSFNEIADYIEANL